MNKKLLRKKLALMLATLKKKRKYYCEVEYLESTGTQYIDLGLKGKNNLDFDYKCIFTNLDGTAQCVGGNWSGAGTSTVSFYLGLIRTNGNFAYHYDGTQSPVVVMNTTVQGTPYSVQGHMWVNEQYMVINGTKSSVGTISSTFTSSLNMYLFGINNNGLSNPAYMKLYYCKIYDNGVLVRDMIPVLDWDMTPCMYDKISGQFFYNQGSGTFQYGREIHYVDYLESDGAQYIDTGILNNTNVKMNFKVKPSSKIGSYFMGVDSGLVFGTNNGVNFRANGVSSINAFDTNTFYTIEMYYNENQRFCVIDGGETLSNNIGIMLDKNILLFAAYDNSTTPKYYLPWSISECKMWDSGTLVRDYLPAIDENGVGFMFDKVTHTIYDNAGTGAFSYPAREVEYLESTGTQYIDTGIIGDLSTEINCEAAIVEAGNASVTNIMGNNVTSSRAITINMSANITNPSTSRIRFGNTDNTTVPGAINLNTFYKYTTNKDNLTVQDIEGTILNAYAFNAITAFTTNGNILIYKLGDTSTQYIGKIKVSKASIKNSGVLVRDFIPCFQDGVAGMLDKQNNVFYPNAGTGAFLTGKVVESEYES